ncbi:MAG TPA: NnrU family protein [Steroidobacteraceae bacterium]|jgi:uncharacterized membrane protein|nr:NnrU family protein [Steroidobacteraceae bacterium]
MLVLIAGLVLFFGAHSVAIIAPYWRDRMALLVGAPQWKGLYAVISIAGFAAIIWGYGLARQSPVTLYMPPPWLRYATFVLMLPVFPLALAAYLPGKIKTATRHPLLAATKLWATGHLLSNGTLAAVLLFGAFLVWAIADRISLKHRVQAPIQTLPAAAFNDAIALVGGLALYVLFVWRLHLWVIGVQPLL